MSASNKNEVDTYLYEIDQLLENPVIAIKEDGNSTKVPNSQDTVTRDISIREDSRNKEESIPYTSVEKLAHSTQLKTLKWVPMQKSKKQTHPWTKAEQDIFHAAYTKLQIEYPVSSQFFENTNLAVAETSKNTGGNWG